MIENCSILSCPLRLLLLTLNDVLWTGRESTFMDRLLKGAYSTTSACRWKAHFFMWTEAPQQIQGRFLTNWRLVKKRYNKDKISQMSWICVAMDQLATTCLYNGTNSVGTMTSNATQCNATCCHYANVVALCVCGGCRPWPWWIFDCLCVCWQTQPIGLSSNIIQKTMTVLTEKNGLR